MEARGVRGERNGNGMDSWRGRGAVEGDEAGDVAGSCSTRRPRPRGRTNGAAVEIATLMPSCLPTSDECTNNNKI